MNQLHCPLFLWHDSSVLDYRYAPPSRTEESKNGGGPGSVGCGTGNKYAALDPSCVGQTSVRTSNEGLACRSSESWRVISMILDVSLMTNTGISHWAKWTVEHPHLVHQLHEIRHCHLVLGIIINPISNTGYRLPRRYHE